jgi:hypothetical protein
LFIRLDNTNPNQRSLGLVVTAVGKLEAAIRSYGSRKGSQSLSLADLRARFLEKIIVDQNPHRRILVTTLISFILEWDHRAQLLELATTASHEIFFMHLFKGCLLFESLLKEHSNPPARGKLENVVKNLKAALGLNNCDVSFGNQDFDEIATSIKPELCIRDVVVTTGRVRNMLGHNLVWPAASLDANKYNLIADVIASACVHAISALYPP